MQMLAEQSHLAHLRILTFCLMTNHIHLVAVPEEDESMWRCPCYASMAAMRSTSTRAVAARGN
jgi:REP element-mobilizing transposase RayT